MVAILDYGAGNLLSIVRACARAGREARITDRPETLRQARHIILPGVGFFASAMASLRDKGLIPVLEERVLGDRTPVLGICLGFQMFARRSEEGGGAGLGWIDAEVSRLPAEREGARVKVPHLGWNALDILQASPYFQPGDTPTFYFAHSYRVQCGDRADVLATSDYGGAFDAVVRRDNILGVQFHPEKSHKTGAEFFARFLETT